MIRLSSVAFVLLIFLTQLNAQLGDGSPAPDFTVNDINGNGWSLYSEMSGGKSACLDFSATWCGPCWAFHNSHVLNDVNSNLSAYTSVLFLESDWNTNTNCLFGPSGCVGGTQGDWVTGTTYPIADLSSTNGQSVNALYKINFYPTLYVISPDFRVWSIKYRTYDEYYNWIVHSFALAATGTVTNSPCGDNGSVILNVTGGYLTKTYKWSNGATTKDLVGIPGGTYTVTITDNQGYFKAFGPWTVTGPQRRVSITSSTQVDVKCNGESTGSLSIGVNYGTPGYEYLWSNGSTSNKISGLSAGIYKVTVTDAVGCTITKSYTITEPAILSQKTTTIDEICDGQNGYISITAKGGVTPYTYYLGNIKSNNGNYNKLKGGNYRIEVVDNNNCRVEDFVYIGATHKPKLVINPPIPISCLKDTIELDAQQSDSGNEFTYEWSSSNGKIIGDKNNITALTALPGNYRLKITNNVNYCESLDSVQVKVDKKFPDITTTGDTLLDCAVPMTILSGSTKTVNTIYYWTKIQSNFKDTSSKILVEHQGEYIFNVKDTINHCISKDTLRILEDKQVPLINIDRVPTLNCAVLNTFIIAENSDKGPDLSFQWFTSNGHFVQGENTLNPLVDKPGTYILKMVNNKNHCEANEAIEILQDIQKPEIKFNSLKDLSCFRKIMEIDAPIQNPKDFEFKWSTKNGNIVGSDSDSKITLDAKGDYNLRVKSKINYCENEENFTIREQEKINADFKYVVRRLEVDFEDLSAQIVLRRLWSFGDGVTSEDPTPTHTYSSEADYEVCLELENECGISKLCRNISLLSTSVLNLTSWEIRPVRCYLGSDGSIKTNVSGGQPPYAYKWSNGETSSEISGLKKGTYRVTITDNMGTILEKSFNVSEPLEIIAESIDIKNENSGFKNGSIQLKISGGIPGYSFKWSNGATTKDIDQLEAGEYSLIVTDANGCDKSFGPFTVNALTSVSESSETISIDLIPNPVEETGWIKIERNHSREVLIEILTVNGKQIKSWKQSGSNILIPFTATLFSEGIYFVKVSDSETTTVKRWIIQ